MVSALRSTCQAKFGVEDVVNLIVNYFYYYFVFRTVCIVLISAPPLPESCLPLGMKAQDNKTKLVPLLPSKTSSFID